MKITFDMHVEAESMEELEEEMRKFASKMSEK